MRKLIILSISLLLAFETHALNFKLDNLWYCTNDDDISVCLGSFENEPLGGIEIPSSVIYNGKSYAVTSVGSYAFFDSRGLTSVTLPKGIASIGDGAFENCSHLISINIPDGVTSIGVSAFGGCSKLTSITIPSSVISLGSFAFEGCCALTTITIPEGITSIGIWTFGGCRNLTSITIPSSVTSIAEAGTFCYCDSLQQFIVAEENRTYITEDGVLFSKDKKRIIAFPSDKAKHYIIPSSVKSIGNIAFSTCRNLASITIPSSVTSIGDSSFCECSSLTSITIPSSVTSIGTWAFFSCSGLQEIYVQNSTPPAGESSSSSVFLQVNKSTCKLYVPIDSKTAYAAAAMWKDFQNIEEIDMTSVPESEEATLMISTDGDGIIITGAEPGASITVYTITGTKLLTLPVTGDEQRIALPSGGLYFVKVGSQTMKVVL